MMTSLAGVAFVSAMPFGASTFAQAAGVDEAELPALMGGDFSTATSKLAAGKATSLR